MIAPVENVWVRSRVVPGHACVAPIERVGPLTPYLTQTIVEDATGRGPGTSVRLELWGAGAGHLTRLRLRRRVALRAGPSVEVAVVRRVDPPKAYRSPSPPGPHGLLAR